eukprot:jgi/Botrbrau1/5139/Bobra.0172s0011.1
MALTPIQHRCRRQNSDVSRNGALPPPGASSCEVLGGPSCLVAGMATPAKPAGQAHPPPPAGAGPARRRGGSEGRAGRTCDGQTKGGTEGRAWRTMYGQRRGRGELGHLSPDEGEDRGRGLGAPCDGPDEGEDRGEGLGAPCDGPDEGEDRGEGLGAPCDGPDEGEDRGRAWAHRDMSSEISRAACAAAWLSWRQ